VVTPEAPPAAVADPARFDGRIQRHAVLEGGFLVVQASSEPRSVLERLVRWEELGPVKFIVAVSEDVDLSQEWSVLWGIFTRFDPARDLIAAEQKFVGARPMYGGRIGIDATWKEGYPEPVVMDPDIVRRVDRRWGEYFPGH
jgi:4-hydroxy-3-polyprenylbenzoate decarboxylase